MGPSHLGIYEIDDVRLESLICEVILEAGFEELVSRFARTPRIPAHASSTEETSPTDRGSASGSAASLNPDRRPKTFQFSKTGLISNGRCMSKTRRTGKTRRTSKTRRIRKTGGIKNTI
jgi:hypothetical protein